MTNSSVITFAKLDQAAGLMALPPPEGEEWALEAWYRSVYHTPLRNLSLDDLARACRQQVHLTHIVPVVLEKICDPATEDVDDLIEALDVIDPAHWARYPSQGEAVQKAVALRAQGLQADIRAKANHLLRAINEGGAA